MRIAAQFHPKISQADDLAETLGPKQVRAPFIQRDDVFRADLRQNPFFFAPHTRAIWPFIAFISFSEKTLPLLRAAIGQRLDVVPHFSARVATSSVVLH